MIETGHRKLFGKLVLAHQLIKLRMLCNILKLKRRPLGPPYCPFSSSLVMVFRFGAWIFTRSLFANSRGNYCAIIRRMRKTYLLLRNILPACSVPGIEGNCMCRLHGNQLLSERLSKSFNYKAWIALELSGLTSFDQVSRCTWDSSCSLNTEWGSKRWGSGGQPD